MSHPAFDAKAMVYERWRVGTRGVKTVVKTVSVAEAGSLARLKIRALDVVCLPVNRG